MFVYLLTKHYLEILSLNGGCTDWSESTHVKLPHCWKSHVGAQLCISLACRKPVFRDSDQVIFNFEKSADDNKCVKNYPACKEL